MNKKKSASILWVIALTAVMTFALVFTGCSDGGGGGTGSSGNNNNNPGDNTPGNSGGTFTVTGIPSTYNGKYAMFEVENNNIYLMGIQNFNTTGGGTLVQIVNGSVALPMWITASNQFVRYSGNHTVEGAISIYNESQLDFSGNSAFNYLAECYWASITFSDGGTTKTWESEPSYGNEYYDYDSVSFSRGINFTRWFDRVGNDQYAGSAQEINFSAYREQDFADVKSLGVDVIRLPINYLPNMTHGAPDYIIDQQLFRLLDRVVGWAEKYQIYIIIDNHPYGNGGMAPTTEPSIQIYKKIWPQIAEHFKSRSKYVIYEILNEPQDDYISSSDWGRMQKEIIDAIRSVDQNHWIVVSGINTGGDPTIGLSSLPTYSDNKLLYTFHFYEPHIFTMQGATGTPFESIVAGLPFPYDSSRMPNELMGTSADDELRRTGNIEHLTKLIDKIADFVRQRNVPVFCGEFGVYRKYAPAEDRVRYYKFIRETLETGNIPWIMWDYFSDFGLFNINSFDQWYSRGDFDTDLNVELVRALGLTPPPQR